MNQRKTSRRLRLALRSLRSLIDQGIEFPDAHFQASQRYHLTEQEDRELVTLYDTAELDCEADHRAVDSPSNTNGVRMGGGTP
jgi:hypothetical protein